MKQEYPCGIPIKYRQLHAASLGVVGFWQATFLKNFGPWKKGERYWHVWVDVLGGRVWAEVFPQGGGLLEDRGERKFRLIFAKNQEPRAAEAGEES